MAFKLFVDSTGVPYSDYGIYNGLNIGKQRSVLSVAERGIYCIDEFELTDTDRVLLSYDWNRYPINKEYEPRDKAAAKATSLKCSDWLLDNITTRCTFAVWTYPYPMSYGTKPGWCSAHAQAVGLQLLARAALVSNDDKYLEPVEGLLAAFEAEVSDGGLLIKENNHWWFDKFADPENSGPRVLNGTMFAIIGLADIAKLLNSEKAHSLYVRGLEAVIAYLPRFDLGDWSAYDIHGRPASAKYHAIHVRQLAQLSAMSGNREIADYCARFEAYTKNS